ncbi:hypothetical protein [Bradyrhizobium sp. HKCCYLR20261]|uniref:hypothetical protein n=1 Tax=Bradyrhizobium sp. HKCCYLR20261 TaxID=3420760 RepID=UPI003EB78BA8
MNRAFFSGLFLAFLSNCPAGAQEVSLTELDNRMTYWITKLPYCMYQEGTFPSKDNCNDGDSVSLNGLSCAAANKRPGEFGRLGVEACEAVKNSRGTKSGAFYRSPKKRYEIENGLPTSDEKPSSNDSAQGVWAYIAEKKDVEAFRAWTGWMKEHKLLGTWPRYCLDNACAFNFADCPMLDRLALYLEQGNSLCDLPPLPSAGEPVQALQAGYEATVKLVEGLPGTKALAPQIDGLKKRIDAALKDSFDRAKQVDEARAKGQTLARVLSHHADFIAYIDGYANAAGPPRQDVAYTAYMLKKYGGFTTQDLANAAEVVASKEPENAFFEYVAHGPTSKMLSQILFINGIQKCPSKESDVPNHPRTSWIWESLDRQTEPGKAQPWVETMYWDCIFVGNLYKSGPIQGFNLPALPGYAEASRAAEQQLQNAIDHTKKLIAALEKIQQRVKDPMHPPSLPEIEKELSDAYEDPTKIVPPPVKGLPPPPPPPPLPPPPVKFPKL